MSLPWEKCFLKKKTCIGVCRKDYWKMIRNIRFYNSRFKCECDNKVDENMIYSYCSFLSNSCRFMISITLWPNMILTKFCTFLFCLKSSRFILKLSAIITSFFKMSFTHSILFKCFSNSLLSPCGDLYVKFRIFFDSSFVISRQRLNSITIYWQILSSFATKRFFHKEKHVLLCDIAYIDENNCSLIKYNSNSVISLEIYTSFQKDK